MVAPGAAALLLSLSAALSAKHSECPLCTETHMPGSIRMVAPGAAASMAC
jgi:hypothetical protein